jgi:quercetin dioxygenase-like cupin family protein
MQLDVGHPIVLRRGDGEEVATTPNRSVLVKADLEQIGVTESWYGSRQHGAGLHLHRAHADSFYVLESELTFVTPAGSLQAPTSAAFVAPPGVVHGFDHDAAEPGRFLNFHTPDRGFIDSMRARRHPETYDPTRYDSWEPEEDAPAGATVIGPRDGDRLERDDRIATIKIARDELVLVVFDLRPGFGGPKAHVHRRQVDAFYVVDGEPELRVGDDTIRGEPGLFVAAPPGVVHSFANPGPGSARVVNVHAPGCSFDEYLNVLDDTADEIDEATHARYDVYEVA